MIKLIQMSVGICVGFVVLLCAGRLFASHVPAPTPPGFGECALPCFAGVTPGLSSADDARAALHRLTGTQGSETATRSSIYVYATQQVQYRLTTHEGRFDALAIDSIQAPALLTFGDMLLTLGAPRDLYFERFSGDKLYNVFVSYALITGNVTLRYRTSSLQLTPTLRADSIFITLPGAETRDYAGMSRMPWRGFENAAR